jgi:hypothetical protein
VRAQQHPFDQGVTGCETGQETRTSGAKEAAEKVVLRRSQGRRAVVSDVSQKTSEIWGTRGPFWANEKKRLRG